MLRIQRKFSTPTVCHIETLHNPHVDAVPLAIKTATDLFPSVLAELLLAGVNDCIMLTTLKYICTGIQRLSHSQNDNCCDGQHSSSFHAFISTPSQPQQSCHKALELDEVLFQVCLLTPSRALPAQQTYPAPMLTWL